MSRPPPTSPGMLDADGGLAVHGGLGYLESSPDRAHNSAVECVLHTDEVTGSIPVAPTKITEDFSDEEGRRVGIVRRSDDSRGAKPRKAFGTRLRIRVKGAGKVGIAGTKRRLKREFVFRDHTPYEVVSGDYGTIT